MYVRLYLCGSRRLLAGKNRTGCGNSRAALECNRFRNPPKKESNQNCLFCPPDRKGVRTCLRAMKHRARFGPFRCHGPKSALRNAESYFPQSTRVLSARYADGLRTSRRRIEHPRDKATGTGRFAVRRMPKGGGYAVMRASPASWNRKICMEFGMLGMKFPSSG